MGWVAVKSIYILPPWLSKKAQESQLSLSSSSYPSNLHPLDSPFHYLHGKKGQKWVEEKKEKEDSGEVWRGFQIQWSLSYYKNMSL